MVGGTRSGRFFAQFCLLFQFGLEFRDLGPNDGLAVALVRVLSEVVLMVVFCGIKDLNRDDLCDDRFTDDSFGGGLGFLRNLFLLWVGVENNRAVLGANVVALAIEGGGIMRVPEQIDHITEADASRIKIDLHHFCMTRGALADGLVGGVFHMAARVAADDFFDALEHFVLGLNAPKTTTSNDRRLKLSS